MQPEENKWLALSQRLQPPAIDPRLEELGALPRSVECLRHFVLSIEYWLSPGGQLRRWLRLNLCFAVWLVMPAVILMPVITLVLHEMDGWFSLLLSISLKLGLLIFMAGCVLRHRLSHFPSSSTGSSRRRK